MKTGKWHTKLPTSGTELEPKKCTCMQTGNCRLHDSAGHSPHVQVMIIVALLDHASMTGSRGL